MRESLRKRLNVSGGGSLVTRNPRNPRPFAGVYRLVQLVFAAIALVILSPSAFADTELYAGEALFRPPVEWSTWLRGSVGVERQGAGQDGDEATGSSRKQAWNGGVGIEASLPLTARGNFRLGGFGELRGLGLSNAFVGGELIITRVPKRMDLFLYKGHGILAMRAGRSSSKRSVSIAYGYLAPFWLEGECKVRFYGVETGFCEQRAKRHTRYMSGVRLVGTWTAERDDNADWSATLGLEFEPAAVVRMITIARSWY